MVYPPDPNPPWHALFAPLPDDAVPRREPVLAPELAARPEGAALAGWEKISLDLAAPGGGMRIVLVMVDDAARPISASDHVMHRSPKPNGETEIRHESLGGRFEPDGTFRGTRWSSLIIQSADDEELETTSTRAEPTEGDVAALRALVAELIRRAPPRRDASPPPPSA